MSQRHFFFGSLRDPEIALAVIGRPLRELDTQPATLPGYRTVCTPNDTAPVLIKDEHGRAPGLLVSWLWDSELSRVAWFESVDYDATVLPVNTADGVVEANVWLESHYAPLAHQPWHYEIWVSRDKPAFLDMTINYMTHFESGDVKAAEAAWDEANAKHMRARADTYSAAPKKT